MPQNKKVFLYMSSGLHTAYKSMIANAPDGFEFVASDYMAHSAITATKSLSPGFAGFTKKIVTSAQPYLSSTYNHLHILLNNPKVRKFYSDEYDLIHSGQSLLDTNLPYVVDFEHAAVFSGYNQYAFRRPGFVKSLEKILINPKLKKLLAWSDAAGKSLTNFITNEKAKAKVETVYPVFSLGKKIKRTQKEFGFLFIGGNFYEKGGYETILAFEKIMDKYDCRLTMIGTIPPELAKKYKNHQKIALIGRVPYEKVVEYYSNSDVFVFPTHYDTYGFVVPEALSFGLPVISTDSFSMPELVEHEKTGLLIKTYFSSFADDFGYSMGSLGELYPKRIEVCKNPPEWYVDSLANAMERLIVDDSLRNDLSKNAESVAKEGKFSPKSWRDKMKRIYTEALE